MSSVEAELLWAEKYRPRSLDEMVNQEEIVKRLKQFVKERNMPHLLFAGPPGTGKTTAAHALAHDFYGPDYRMYMLELNASVTKDTPILVKVNGKTCRTTFKELDRLYFNNDSKVLKLYDGEYVKVNDLDVLGIDKSTGKVKWFKASWIIRHKAKYVVKITLKGGGVIKLTGNHSVLVIDEDGNLVEKKASEIRPDDYLISFVTTLQGDRKVIDLEKHIIRNHSRIKAKKHLILNEKSAWLLGLYVAEGALGFRKSISNILTSGQAMITVSYPKEISLATKVIDAALSYDIPIYINLVGSGFNRERSSAMQIRLLNTALARYLMREAYSEGRIARFKRVPSMIYESHEKARIAFLKGVYEGEGSGKWGSVVRIVSKSKDLLIDLAWLARITGIESSIYDNEVRLIWKGRMKYKKSDLLPVKPFIKFFKKIEKAININWRYVLRHQLYEGKETVPKEKLKSIMESIDIGKLNKEEYETYKKLVTLINSDIHVIKVTDTEVISYGDYVYDISVPGNETFFAGTIPILLHNSDERGIDVIRSKVKEFARSKLPAEIPFKIVLLDEADNMTADAQQALRRLMEMYVGVTRFILIANYPSKIIEPIQSRCAVFRFTPLKKEDVIARLKWIAEKEKVSYDNDALEVIFELSEGDLRRAINLLQASAALGKVTVTTVYKVVGLAHPKEIREMIKLAFDGKFLEARNKLRQLMIDYGLSGLDVVKQLHREIFSPDFKVPEELRVIIADYLGEIQFRLVEGADDEIQLNALLARLALLGRKFSSVISSRR